MGFAGIKLVHVEQRRPLCVDGRDDKHPPSFRCGYLIENVAGRDAVVVATGCGYVVNLEGSTGPWKVVQALREQSGISTPIRAPLWITPY